MRNSSNGLQLEHEVEGRNLQRADMRHAQHVGHMLDGRARQPAFLFLCTKQKRDDRAGLTTFGILGDLPFGPGEVRRREGERGGLFLVKAAQH